MPSSGGCIVVDSGPQTDSNSNWICSVSSPPSAMTLIKMSVFPTQFLTVSNLTRLSEV